MIPAFSKGVQSSLAKPTGAYASKQGALSGTDVASTLAGAVPIVGPILGGLIDLFSPDPEPVAPPPPPKEKFQLVQPQRTPFTPAPRPDMSAPMIASPGADRSAAFANMMAGRRLG